MSQFTEILVVSPLADGKTWVTRKEFSYDIGSEGSGNKIEVPIGFKTDFASVPCLFRWLFPRWGKYGNAAVIHDYCYWQQMFPRERADEIMKEAMVVLNVKPFKIKLIYFVVRTFGGLAWKNNQKKKRRGFEKIAKTLPIKCDAMP